MQNVRPDLPQQCSDLGDRSEVRHGRKGTALPVDVMRDEAFAFDLVAPVRNARDHMDFEAGIAGCAGHWQPMPVKGPVFRHEVDEFARHPDRVVLQFPGT